MRITLTGSQHGCTTAQLHTFRDFIFENIDEIEKVRQGCCVGFDTMATLFLVEILDPKIIHCYPSSLSDKTGIFKKDFPQLSWHHPQLPLVRNKSMVELSDLVVAAPRTDEEQQRSGTWATIRCASKAGIEVKQLRRMGGFI